MDGDVIFFHFWEGYREGWSTNPKSIKIELSGGRSPSSSSCYIKINGWHVDAEMLMLVE